MKNKFNLGLISDARNILYGISALWIALFHSSINFDFLLDYNNDFLSFLYKILFEIKNVGQFGVEIFLFLSGMGLYFSFSNNENLKEYYKKRFIRIVPASLIVAIIWKIIKFNGIANYIQGILFLEVFYNGNHTFWYITAIIIFYLIYPLLFKCAKRYGNNIYLFLILLTYINNIFFESSFPVMFSRIEIFLSRIPVFLFGCYFGKYIKENKEISMLVAYFSYAIFLVLFSILVINNAVIINILRIIYMFLAFALILIVSSNINAIKKLHIDKILSFFGCFSLEIYLIYEKVNNVCSWLYIFWDPMNFVYSIEVFVVTLLLSILLKKVSVYISNKLLNL